MRKWFVLFLAAVLLTACGPVKMSLKEVTKVPAKVEKSIDPNLTLQSVNTKDGGHYIVFHSAGDVRARAVEQGNAGIVKIDVKETEDATVKRHVFYFTNGPKQDTIDVLINGESTPFDEVSSPGK